MLKKVIIMLAIIIFGGVVGAFGLGKIVLFIIKKDFSINSYGILKILFASLLPHVVVQFYITFCNIKKWIVYQSYVSSAVLLTLLFSCFGFVITWGVKGAAYSWLFANILGALAVSVIVFLKRKDFLRIE